jgi:hypothetical protein
MPRRTQIFVLFGLLAALLVVAYFQFRSEGDPAPVPVVNLNFVPLPVENPALRLDLLDRLKTFQYQGPHRNIFIASLPPPVPAAAPAIPAAPPKPVAPPVPAGPPPLVVPATFFGYVTDARTGTRRAFFNDGDDVYVVAIGETLLGRYRLLQLGNNTAQVEETSTGRTTTLTMTQEPGSS